MSRQYQNHTSFSIAEMLLVAIHSCPIEKTDMIHRSTHGHQYGNESLEVIEIDFRANCRGLKRHDSRLSDTTVSLKLESLHIRKYAS